MSRRGHSTLSAAIALILLTALSASAQERLFVMRFSGELSELDTADDSLGTVRQVTQLPRETRGLRIAGARFLLVYVPLPSPRTALALFDTRTFTATVLPFSFPGPVLLEADNFRPRVFYRTETEIGVIAPPTFGPRPLIFTPTDLFLGGVLIEYADATNQLLLTRAIALQQAEIVAIDAETGAIKGVIPADGAPEALLVDNLGRRLYVPARQPLPFSFDTEIRVYDLDSLELLSKSRSYKLPLGVSWQFDAMRQQILVGLYGGVDTGSAREPLAFSVDADLKPHARADFGYLEFDQQTVHTLQLFPSTVRDQTFAVLARGAIAPSTLGQWHEGKGVLVGMDADRLRPTANVDLHVTGASFDRNIVATILLTPPSPPTPLEFAVTDRRVDLKWRDPGDTTHFVLEVGTSPGRSNLGILHVGNTETWGVDRVPSGTYYVRVRAANDVGPSLPTNEVVITVP